MKGLVLIPLIFICSACDQQERQDAQQGSAAQAETSTVLSTEIEQPAAIKNVFDLVQAGEILSEKNFTALANWHNSLPTEARRDQLRIINDLDPKLAEAILLRRVANTQQPSDAYVQYVTSTDKREPIQSDDDKTISEWASAYASRLQVDVPDSLFMKMSLVKRLKKINVSRYDRNDVVPVAAFDFQDQEAYTLENAMWLAEMASLAYEKDKARIAARLKGWGYADANAPTHFFWIDDTDTDTQAFIIANETRMILSFRGTSSFKDALVDAKFPLVDEDNGRRVHRGFKAALDPEFPAIANFVQENLGKRRLFVTGHSLGAALAQLAALRLESMPGIDVTAVYTFGSPRVGDLNYAKHYNEILGARTYLHINHDDIVTRVPPRWTGFEYTVLGRQAIRKFTGNLHAIENFSADQLDNDTPPPIAQREEAFKILVNEADTAIDQLWGFRAPTDAGPVFSYGGDFERERFDDHGVSQYIFKLGCAIIEVRKNLALRNDMGAIARLDTGNARDNSRPVSENTGH